MTVVLLDHIFHGVGGVLQCGRGSTLEFEEQGVLLWPFVGARAVLVDGVYVEVVEQLDAF